MNPAPNKTQKPSCLSPLTVSALTNPALEQIQSALARQNRELDAAFSSVSRFADVSFAIRPELLEEIDAACTTRPAARGALLTSTRC